MTCILIKVKKVFQLQSALHFLQKTHHLVHILDQILNHSLSQILSHQEEVAYKIINLYHFCFLHFLLAPLLVLIKILPLFPTLLTILLIHQIVLTLLNIILKIDHSFLHNNNFRFHHLVLQLHYYPHNFLLLINDCLSYFLFMNHCYVQTLTLMFFLTNKLKFEKHLWNLYFFFKLNPIDINQQKHLNYFYENEIILLCLLLVGDSLLELF